MDITFFTFILGNGHHRSGLKQLSRGSLGGRKTMEVHLRFQREVVMAISGVSDHTEIGGYYGSLVMYHFIEPKIVHFHLIQPKFMRVYDLNLEMK